MAKHAPRNSGITGLVDLPGLSAKFEMRIYRFAPRLNGQTRDRRGRGGGMFKSVRWVFSSGTFAVAGKIRLDGKPSPDAWKGQTGTIRAYATQTKYIDYPVIVTSGGFNFDEKSTDLWDAVLACELTAAPAYAGWGTLPAATDPDKSDQEQWQGTSKVYDPSGLLTRATRLIDVWGTLGDTDADEQTLIVSTISSATPFTAPHDLKLVTRSFQRDAIDGGTVVEEWALRDSTDQVEQPSQRVTEDADGITNSAVETVVFNQGDSAPSAAVNITPPADTKLVRTSLGRQNDSRRTATLEFDLNTPKEAIERRQSRSVQGTSVKIGDEEIVVVFTGSATSDPSGLNPDDTNLDYHSTSSYRWSDTQWLHIHRFAPLTVGGEIEAGANQTDVDPGTVPLVDEAVRCVVDANSTAPSAPSVAGRVCVRQYTKQRGKVGYAHFYFYRFRSNEDQLIAGRTRTTVDVSGLASSAVTADVWEVSGGPPSAPTLSGYVLRDHTDFETPNPLYRLRVYEWGLTTRETDIERGGTVAQYTIANSLVSNFLARESTVSESSDPLATIGGAALAANLTSITFDSLTARRIPGAADNKYELTIARTNDDRMVRWGRPYTSRVRWPLAKGGATIKIAAAKAVSAGGTIYIVGAHSYEVSYQPIVVRRRWVAYDCNDYSTVLQVNGWGARNNGDFLGFGAGFVKFIGAELVDNIQFTTTDHLMVVDYYFLASDDAHRSYSGPDIGDECFDPTGTISAAGDTAVANVDGAAVGQTSAVSFSFFVT